MAVAYPESLPTVLASKRVSKVPRFSMAQPRRGTPYVEPTGTDTPTIFEVEWLLLPDQAVVLRDWVEDDLEGGALQFTMPLRTEDGIRIVTGNFMPDGLLDRQREGTLWRYRATIVARNGRGAPPSPPAVAPVASFYGLVSSGTPTYQSWNQFAVNGSPSTALDGATLEAAGVFEAQGQFVAASGAGAPYTFESLSETADGALSLSFTDAASGVQVTASGTTGRVRSAAAGTTEGGGRYSVPWSSDGSTPIPADGGSKFLQIVTNGAVVTFTFSELMCGFGLYLTDYLDFGGTCTWRFFNGATELASLSVPPKSAGVDLSSAEAEGCAGFIGYVSDSTAAPFNSMTMTFSSTASDRTGFDNIFVATLAGRPYLAIAAGSTVQFTDTSTNSPTSWLWNFGDSTTSTAQNPTKTYSTPGTYTVTLTATNAGGSDGETKTGYIVVS